MSPNHINLYGLVTSMAPKPLNSQGSDGRLFRLRRCRTRRCPWAAFPLWGGKVGIAGYTWGKRAFSGPLRKLIGLLPGAGESSSLRWVAVLSAPLAAPQWSSRFNPGSRSRNFSCRYRSGLKRSTLNVPAAAPLAQRPTVPVHGKYSSHKAL
jgi:hypothetical protein